jgi:hypothetical protein
MNTLVRSTSTGLFLVGLATAGLYAAASSSSAVPKKADSSAINRPLSEAATLSEAASTALHPARVKPKANRSASLIFEFYGDSDLTTLFQETLKLKKAMEDYDFKVLLKDERTASWLDFSEKDEKLANIKDVPTKENLFKYLIQLANDGYYIDLYIFAHGNPGQFSAKPKGPNKDEAYITTDAILSRLSPEATGLTHIPIRIVWGTYCYGQTLGETWRAIGAKATAGARYVQFYPSAYGRFIDDWNKGNVDFGKAVHDADTDFVRTAAQTYIAAHATSCRGVWGGCPLLKTVLGDDSCSKDYFTKWRGNQDGSWGGWLDNSEWQAGQSGKDNMNYSSYMFVGGDKDITKNRKPVW